MSGYTEYAELYDKDAKPIAAQMNVSSQCGNKHYDHRVQIKSASDHISMVANGKGHVVEARIFHDGSLRVLDIVTGGGESYKTVYDGLTGKIEVFVATWDGMCCLKDSDFKLKSTDHNKREVVREIWERHDALLMQAKISLSRHPKPVR